MIQKLKYKLMAKSRERKYNEFKKLSSLNCESNILDVGAADKEFSPYDNYLEKAYQYHSQITVLSIFDLDIFKVRYPSIKAVTYSGGRFPFSDKQFSVVYSNAVIEHVGNTEEQLEFIKEMARCGQQFYFSTPAKEFLFEIHTNYPFIHWFPKPFFNFLVTKSGKGWAAGDFMYLLTKPALHRLLQRAEIKKYQISSHKILGFPYQHVVFGSS